MKRTKTAIILALLFLYGLIPSAFAQEAPKAKSTAGAKKVTVTLVRWPYT